MKLLVQVVEKVALLMDDSIPEPPVWMTELFQLVQNSQTHVNIRLFLAKLVMNTFHVLFKRFPEQVWRCLGGLIAEGEKFGKRINWMIHLLRMNYKGNSPTVICS